MSSYYDAMNQTETTGGDFAEDEIPWPNGSLERAAYELVSYLRDAMPQQGTWGEATVLDRGESLTISDLVRDVEDALRVTVNQPAGD